jgi:hypothetical protein
VDLIDQDQKTGFIDSIKDYLELDDTYPIHETSIYSKSIFTAMEVIINELSLDPQSIEGTIQNFEKQNKDQVEQILLVDGRDNTIVSTIENDLDIKEKMKVAQQTLEASFNINEPLSYSFYQFNSKLAFISTLKDYHSLLIIYSANKPEILDETYIKLVNSSLSLSKDLNNLL